MIQGKRLARGAALQVGGRVARVLVGIVTFSIASRVLGVTRFGDYVFVYAYLLLFTTLASFGVDNIVIRDLAQDESRPEDHAQFVRTTAMTKLLLAVIGTALCIATTGVLRFPNRVVLEAALFSPYLVLTLFGSNGLFGSILQAHHRSGAIATVSTIASLVTLAATAAAAWAGGGVSLFLAAYLMAGVTDCILSYAYIRSLAKIRFRWDPTAIAYVLRESYPLGIALAFVLVYTRIDTVLLETLTNPRQVALYGVAYKFFDVLNTISATVMLVVFPVLTRAYQHGREALRSLYARVFTIMLALALPVAYAAMAFRQPLILLIVGRKYMDAELAVPGLMLAVAIIFPASLITYMLVVTHLQRWNLPLAILACGVNIGLNLWLIPRGGYVAAAWTTAATEAFVLVYNLTVLGVATRIFPAIRPVGKVLLAALPFGVVLIPGVPTYAAAGVAIAVYGVLLVAFGVVRPSQLRALMVDKTDTATVGGSLRRS